MRYQWEQPPNPEVNILHVDTLLPNAFDVGRGPCWEMESLDDEDRQFLCDLVDVPGVVSVTMHDYHCQVVKGVLFPWELIRPAILEAFRARYAPRGLLVEAGPMRRWVEVETSYGRDWRPAEGRA